MRANKGGNLEGEQKMMDADTNKFQRMKLLDKCAYVCKCVYDVCVLAVSVMSCMMCVWMPG